MSPIGRPKRLNTTPKALFGDQIRSRDKESGRQITLPPLVFERTTYFRLVIAVRSAENFTTPAALHQLEP